jgi:hypothetical protein
MVNALRPVESFADWGVFLISCYKHAQSQDDFAWNGRSKVDGVVISHPTLSCMEIYLSACM